MQGSSITDKRQFCSGQRGPLSFVNAARIPLAMLSHRPRHGKPGKEKVAMIAQKTIDAKHSQEPRSEAVAAADLLASAFWAPLPDHLCSPIGRALRLSASQRSAQISCVSGACASALSVVIRARNSSISREIRSAAAAWFSSLKPSRVR